MPGVHTPTLVDGNGFVVLGVDHSAINAWGAPNAMRALDDAYSYLVNTFKMPTAKIGIQAWSMGGLTALNWALRNPAKVAGLWAWNPATDLQFWQNAGYSPTYSAGGITAGAYASEVNGDYAPSTTHSTTGTINAAGGAGITMVIANGKPFSDATTLGGSALPQATVNSATFTYTSKDDTHLYGCVATGVTPIVITSGQTVTGVYGTQSPGYSPWQNASAFSVGNGFTFPIKIVQATDDTTVPPAMNNDATHGFIARTGNANITARSPAVTGGHSGAISNVPSTEVVAFFNNLTW
jgi:pimeloyl-ACP methyl ester carboxylesterase